MSLTLSRLYRNRTLVLKGLTKMSSSTLHVVIGNLLAGLIFAGVSPDRIFGIELDPVIHALAVERLGKLGVPSDHIVRFHS